jgi:hypothetical protein
VTSGDPCLLTTAEVSTAFGTRVGTPKGFRHDTCQYGLPALGLQVEIELYVSDTPAEEQYQSMLRGATPDEPVEDVPGLGDHAVYEPGRPTVDTEVGTTHVMVMQGTLWIFVSLQLPIGSVDTTPPGIGLLTEPATKQKLVDLATKVVARAPTIS